MPQRTPPTFGEMIGQTTHRSLWRSSLERRAGGRPLDEWLVEQANLRLFKLVLRILQSGRIDPPTLAVRSRRERADHILWWFMQHLPPTEVNEAVASIRTQILSKLCRADTLDLADIRHVIEHCDLKGRMIGSGIGLRPRPAPRAPRATGRC